MLSTKFSAYFLFSTENRLREISKMIALRKREMLIKSSKKAGNYLFNTPSKTNRPINIAMTSNESLSGSLLKTDNSFEKENTKEDFSYKDLLRRKKRVSRLKMELSVVHYNTVRLILRQRKEPEGTLILIGSVAAKVF